MPRAFVCVGSNIDPAQHVLQAVQRLAARARVWGVSTVCRTAAVGRPEQADYYNCVIGVETSLPPLEFKSLLHAIEGELGRRRNSDRYAARSIDLDIVMYDMLVLNEPELTLPDPDILTRAFLAAGLSELAPDLVLPGCGRKVSDIAAELSKDAGAPLLEYTAYVRRAVLPDVLEGNSSQT